MDLTSLNVLLTVLFIFLDDACSVDVHEIQCLTCDNLLDGPGCGEFTRQIAVTSCRTFCYFTVLHDRSSSFGGLPSTGVLRAIRDCSPSEDMLIEGYQLLEPKLGSSASSSIEILTMKRCNSEQCNNDFYLKAEELLTSGSSARLRRSFPLGFVRFVIIFYSLKNMFWKRSVHHLPFFSFLLQRRPTDRKLQCMRNWTEPGRRERTRTHTHTFI